MKIYDHPLNSNVTVIEIDKLDENNSFLDKIIDDFEKYGFAYPSSSCGDRNDRKVIYLDGRRRSLFNLDDTDMLCDLTVRLAEIEHGSNSSYDVATRTLSIAESSGESELLERLLSQPPEYFSNF